MLRARALRTFHIILVVSALYAIECVADHEDTLDTRYESLLFDYDLLFDPSEPYDCTEEPTPDDVNLNFFPAAQGINAILALDSFEDSLPGIPAGYHLGYTNLGFPTPDFNGQEDEILIYDCAPGSVHDDEDCDNGRANPERIILPSTRYCASAEISVRRLMGHELFHHVEYATETSSAAWGKVAFEGTARMMEDQIYSDIDDHPNTAFLREIGRYLKDPSLSFWDTSYKSALGWKHLAEQYGQISTEPELGADFIQTFWDIVAANADSPDVPGTVETTIQTFDPDASLRDWFQDFAIANIAKEFDATGLPEAGKYHYIDEDAAGVTYSDVQRVYDGIISDNFAFSTGLFPWAASYNEVAIDPACPGGSIFGFRATSADTFRYAVLAINNVDEVERIVRGGGSDFAAAFIQTGSGIGDPYDRLLTVITSKDDFDAAGWEFACGPGSLEIRYPNEDYVAFVGPKETPRPLQIRLLVEGPEALSDVTVLGLQPTDFTVYIGNNFDSQDQAEILNGGYVGSEFWLSVRPPVKDSEELTDLHVSMGNFYFGSELDAVSYESRIFDQMLVIDTSGSMDAPTGSPKIDAAKTAASLFVDLAVFNDELGAVSFSNNATVQAVMRLATDSHRNIIINRINNLTASGGTSIGDGLDSALEQHEVNGSAVGDDWIVLLSDGQENEPLFWGNVEQPIKDAGIKISTIALGADADQVLMQEIAEETGGEYYFVNVSAEEGANKERLLSKEPSERGIGDGPLSNRLADAYASAHEAMTQRQRIFDQIGTLLQGDEQDYVLRVDGGGIVDGLFIVHWADPSDVLSATITRPDGSDLVDGQDGVEIFLRDTHAVFQVDEIEEGDWRIGLSAGAGNPNYSVIVSGDDRQGAELSVNLGQSINASVNVLSGGHYLRGLPVPIRATLQDKSGRIDDAQVFAQIEHPNGPIHTLPLFDDGEHDDGFKNDGVYGNNYTVTTVFSLNDQPDGTGTRGSYNIVVEATGRDNMNHAFTRIKKKSFQVLETDHITTLPSSDTDNDGMPNRYEELHECLNPAVDDASDDSDGDSILNFGSYLLGFDPCHPDTDRGGETDVSEISRGANYFDPGDDIISRIIDAEVIDWIYEHLPVPGPDELQPNANLIRYQVHQNHAQIDLLRSLNITGPFLSVTTFDAQVNAGLYRDGGLVNGTTYFYRLQPIDAAGNRAAPSHVFSGTPNVDPIPPIGSMQINGGAQKTTDLIASLSMVASSDTVSMRLANNPTLEGAPWVPYQSSVFWPLVPNEQTGNVATVHVQFLDANNNESPSVYHASIQVVDPSDVGTLRGFARLEGQAEHANIFAQVVRPSVESPDFTGVSGVYTLARIQPGTYDIHFSYPGYQDETVTDVQTVAGQTTFLPDVTLLAIDSDVDGVPDTIDNCTLVANASQLDTNLDGYGNVCDADLNNDCQVNFLDVGQMAGVFLSTDADADLDGSGFVNFLDFALLQSLFLNPPGPSAVGNCP